MMEMTAGIARASEMRRDFEKRVSAPVPASASPGSAPIAEVLAERRLAALKISELTILAMAAFSHLTNGSR